MVWRSTLGSTTEMRWRSPLPTSRWPSLIILQAITGRRGCSSWRRIGSSGWGPLGRRDSTPEISCSVNKEGIGVQAINLKLPFDSPEFGFIFPQFHHFHFSPFTFQHIVGRSQFSALCHSDLREHLVSHTGEKPLRCTTSLGSHELFLIFSFWFSRYRGLHWGWGGSARGGGGRRWMRGKATQIQLVFPIFWGDEQNYCLLVLNFVKISFRYRRMLVISLSLSNL